MGRQVCLTMPKSGLFGVTTLRKTGWEEDKAAVHLNRASSSAQ
jgi:hypothetical protein